MAITYFMFRTLFSTAISMASAIQDSGYSSDVSRSRSATMGVSSPMLRSYNAKIFGRAASELASHASTTRCSLGIRIPAFKSASRSPCVFRTNAAVPSGNSTFTNAPGSVDASSAEATTSANGAPWKPSASDITESAAISGTVTGRGAPFFW